jgi:hypothetical protein
LGRYTSYELIAGQIPGQKVSVDPDLQNDCTYKCSKLKMFDKVGGIAPVSLFLATESSFNLRGRSAVDGITPVNELSDKSLQRSLLE